MSKRTRKKRSSITHSEVARRQLEKGDAKTALKEAKLGFQSEPSTENRTLLEQAFLGRVEQLYRQRQIADAKAVLADLLAFQPLAPEVTQRIPRLQVIIGDSNANVEAILEANPSLLTEMVDQAVLDARCDALDDGNIKPQLAAVREALAAVERGDDEAAAERLKIISRTSPLADWRLFVRGLSAYYQKDQERTASNWERLDATRPAHRIAQSLLAAADMNRPAMASPAAADVHLLPGVRKLLLHSPSDPAYNVAKHLAAAWGQRDWREFFRHYRVLRQRFAKSHESLLGQTVEIVWKRAVREADDYMLDQLSRIGPPPHLDPRWNRAKALLAEHPRSEKSINEIEDAWVDYAEDARQLACLREDERPIAEGLVFQRLAGDLKQYGEHLDRSDDYWDEEDELEQRELYDAARNYYRKSIQACPGLKESYLELANLHEECDEPEKAARVMEKLARLDHDCFDAAIWLARYYIAQDQPGKSEPYVHNVRRLRPRDPQCEVLTWNLKVTMIRALTIKRMFQAARAEIEQAAEFAPSNIEPYTLDLLRAGVEFKAKNADAAHRHVESALSKVDEPTSVWLQMSCAAARMRVAREYKKIFDDRFKADIRKPATSGSAGRMARFLRGLKLSKANYTGRATQEKLFVEYLKKGRRIPWKERDLRDVCAFLQSLPKHAHLLTRYLETGLQAFPQNPYFHLWTALRDVDRGPFYCDVDEVLEHLQSAVDLHQQGDIKLKDWELEEARAALSMLKDVQERQESFYAASDYDDDDYDDDDDDEEDDDDDEDEDDQEEFNFIPLGPAEARANEDGCPFPDSVIAMLEQTMPPEVKSNLERVAQMMGASPTEALRRMAAAFAEGREFDFEPSATQPKRQKKPRR